MTDTELEALEAAARKTKDTIGIEERLQAETCFVRLARPMRILSLIAELRQMKAEQDWLASRFLKGGRCPSKEAWRKCDLDNGVDCKTCWLNAAKEATCQK
ncbi:MAG: hypothetical protein K6F46_10000 [Desulfovibrio sp.]|nr:hypothetical protein [Desulfovibrio sp.]